MKRLNEFKLKFKLTGVLCTCQNCKMKCSRGMSKQYASYYIINYSHWESSVMTAYVCDNHLLQDSGLNYKLIKWID